MKKFISTLTSLAMSASLTAGALAVPFAATTAAGEEKTLKILSDKTTISAADIAAGDVTVTCGLYLEETNNDTASILTHIGFGDVADASAVKFTENIVNPFETVPSHSATIVGGDNDGKTITATTGLFFEGAVAKRDGKFTPQGGMDVSKVSDSEIGICWTTATAAPWLGATSDAFPVCTFDVTFAKGAKPGKYNIELLNTNLPGQDNQSMTQVGKLDLSLPTLDQNHNGGLGEKNLTITIEGDETPTTTSTTPAVTTSTSATTSTSVNTTTSTQTTTNTTPTGDGLVWDIADIDYNKAEEYQYVDVNVTQAYGSDRLKDGVAGLQCAIKYDQDVLELVPLESGKSGAYGVVDYGTYMKDTGFTWGWANGDENGGLIANKGDNVTYFAFKVKDGAPAGTYPITVDTTYSFACSDGLGTRVPLTILPGSITIKGDTTTDTTTATSETTTSATTTTTSATTTSETTKATDPTTASETTKATDPITGDVLYGDSNVDGKVNIADVVILNKYLTNAAKYPLSAQGAKNAEVDLDGTLTTNDSYCIIRAVVKLITLPYKA